MTTRGREKQRFYVPVVGNPPPRTNIPELTLEELRALLQGFAPQQPPEKEPMLPPPGLAAGPLPGPPMPMPPPPKPPMMPPPGPMAGGPPMPPPGGPRPFATGGGVFEAGRRSGTQVQHSPGKNDLAEMNRPKVVTYKTGGAVESNKAPMGPKFDGGSRGGSARLEKAARAAKVYAKA